VTYDYGSRSKLSRRALPHFQEDTLFHHIARVVCASDCLPRKELYESWEVARRARRRFRGGRVIDAACGHALVAHMMLLLDDSSPDALAIDTRLPDSAHTLNEAMMAEWPRLRGRVQLVQGSLEDVRGTRGDVVVSAHACGSLTDRVLELSLLGSSRVVVLPCCHEKATGDAGGLGGWLDSSLAIDVTRAARLRAHGYTVHTQLIPPAITPKNRLLLAAPARAPAEPQNPTSGS
jgi:hypothetical protein